MLKCDRTKILFKRLPFSLKNWSKKDFAWLKSKSEENKKNKSVEKRKLKDGATQSRQESNKSELSVLGLSKYVDNKNWLV